MTHSNLKLSRWNGDASGHAKEANAHEFITKYENGYDTIRGERGCTLSGGQRQSIAIARTLIRDVPIFILSDLVILVLINRPELNTHEALRLAARSSASVRKVS